MLRPAIAPAVRRPSPNPPRLRPDRYPLARRDPRRFARGTVRLDASPLPAEPEPSDWRFFAHSFAGAFLFVSLIIA